EARIALGGHTFGGTERPSRMNSTLRLSHRYTWLGHRRCLRSLGHGFSLGLRPGAPLLSALPLLRLGDQSSRRFYDVPLGYPPLRRFLATHGPVDLRQNAAGRRPLNDSPSTCKLLHQGPRPRNGWPK